MSGSTRAVQMGSTGGLSAKRHKLLISGILYILGDICTMSDWCSYFSILVNYAMNENKIIR
jgi:hypothetical protein